MNYSHNILMEEIPRSQLTLISNIGWITWSAVILYLLIFEIFYQHEENFYYWVFTYIFFLGIIALMVLI